MAGRISSCMSARFLWQYCKKDDEYDQEVNSNSCKVMKKNSNILTENVSLKEGNTYVKRDIETNTSYCSQEYGG